MLVDPEDLPAVRGAVTWLLGDRSGARSGHDVITSPSGTCSHSRVPVAGVGRHSGSVDQQYVELPGSERAAASGVRGVGPVPPEEQVTVTVVLRRRTELPEATVQAGSVAPESFADMYGADPADVEVVRRVVTDAGAQVVEVDLAGRRVRARGPAAGLAALFGTTLTRVRSEPPGGGAIEHRHRVGALALPAALDGLVLAVLGLDDRPQARSFLRVARAAAAAISYTPLQVAGAYRMPTGTDGAGQTLAIIELGGGFAATDLDTYFAGLGLSTPKVIAVGVDGSVNQPGSDPTGADGEVLLDIEVAGAIAPRASVIVYFAPNTDAGFLDAIAVATHATPTPTAISISWGQNEDEWTTQSRTAMDQAFADAAALGITVTAAAGDSGSSDAATDGAVHVDFPAASPHVLGCGGTTLRTDPATGAISSETVWNDGSAGGATGGGVSDAFPLPSWQQNAGVPANATTGRVGRGVPDVAGNADPQTGYQVYVDGSPAVFGGTSAVSPLWAALVCRFSQALNARLGLMQPRLYAGAAPGRSPLGFHDITVGANGSYAAAAGWDACTGLGTPDGAALLARLTPPR